MKNQKGFTLIEMLVVLLIISVLLLITLPNVTKSTDMIDAKGCEALKELVESQVQLYKIDKGVLPTDISTLITEEYLEEENTTCPNGTPVLIDTNGEVQ